MRQEAAGGRPSASQAWSEGPSLRPVYHKENVVRHGLAMLPVHVTGHAVLVPSERRQS